MHNKKEYKLLPPAERIRFAILKTINNLGKVEKSRKVLPALLKDQFNITSDLEAIKTKKNKTNYWEFKIAWAITALKMAGLIEYPHRGAACITQKGKDFLKTHDNDVITEDDLRKYPEFLEYAERSRPKKNAEVKQESEVKQQDTIEQEDRKFNVAVDVGNNVMGLLTDILKENKIIITIELKKTT